jgi:hypothetical protein
MKLHTAEDVEQISFAITEKEFPKLFAGRLADLMNGGGMAEEDAREHLAEHNMVHLEVYFSPGLAVFGLEAEALEFGAKAVDPFTKKVMRESK